MRKEQTKKKILMNNCTRMRHGIGREGREEAVDVPIGDSYMNGWGGKGSWMVCAVVDRGGRKRGMRKCGGGGCLKAVVEKNLMGAEKSVVVTVSDGKGRAISDVMGD